MKIELSAIIGSKIPFEVKIGEKNILLEFGQLTQGHKAYLENLYGTKQYEKIFLESDIQKVIDILFYLLDSESKKKLKLFKDLFVVSPPKLSFFKNFYRLRYWLCLFKKRELIASSDRDILGHLLLADVAMFNRLVCKVNGMPDNEIERLENLSDEKKTELLKQIESLIKKQ